LNIDLFTFIAQIINFIILVLLLRHFLYKRIVRVMDQREEDISSRIKDAEERKKEADKEKEKFEKKKSEIEEKQERMISDAEKEAEERKKELIQKARDEVDQKQKHWYESLQKQKQAFLNDLRVRTGEQVFDAVRKALKELADEDIEKHIITTFLDRIQDLEKSEKKEFSQSLSQSDHAAKIRSRFKLSKNMKQKIEKTVKDTFSKEVQLEFKTSDEMIGGIELESNDRKIAWNIDSYLSDLENNIAETFEQRSSNKNRSKGTAD